jgi:hypothetical protein
MEKHSSIQELNEFLKIIKRMDKLIENHIEKRKNISSRRYIYRSFHHNHLYRYYDYVIRDIIGYCDRQNGSFKKDNLPEGEILGFQDQLIPYITSEKDNMIVLQEYKNIAERLFTMEANNLINILLIINDSEFFRPILRSGSKKFDPEVSTYSRAISVMSILKLILSTIYSYSELSKGISFPFDDNSIIKILNISSKKDL